MAPFDLILVGPVPAAAGVPEATQAWRLFLVTTTLLLLFGLGIVALLMLRRHRRRSAARPRLRPLRSTDPWGEAALRMRVSAETEDGEDIDADDIPPPDKNH